MVSAQGRFGIGAFCFKTKDTNNICSNGVPRTTGKNKFSSTIYFAPLLGVFINHKKAHAAQVLNSFSFEGQKKQKPFFPLRQPAQSNRTQKPKAHGLRFTET